MDQTERVVVGRIGRAHGIRGDLTVDTRTDEPERRFAAGASVLCRVGTLERTLTVVSARPHAGRLIVRFAEVPDRTAAEQLHGGVLEAEVDLDETPDEDDAWYDRHLVGLTVLVAGAPRGRVREVLHLPAHDSLLIDLDAGAAPARSVQVPFVSALVPEVDVEGGTVTVVDRPGLLDPDTADEVR